MEDANRRKTIEIATVNASHVQNILYALKDMYARCRIRVTPESLSIHVVDDGGVIGTYVTLYRAMFEMYEVTPSRPVFWGISPSAVFRMMDWTMPTHHLHFVQYADAPDLLTIKQVDDSDGDNPLVHVVRLVAMNPLVPGVHQCDPAMSLRVRSKQLNSLLRGSARGHGGTVRVEGWLKPPRVKLTLLNQGSETSRSMTASRVVSTPLPDADEDEDADEDQRIETLVEEFQAHASQLYNSKYVEKISRAHRLHEYIVLHLPKKGGPLHAVYVLDEGRGEVRYLLGPRCGGGGGEGTE